MHILPKMRFRNTNIYIYIYIYIYIFFFFFFFFFFKSPLLRVWVAVREGGRGERERVRKMSHLLHSDY